MPKLKAGTILPTPAEDYAINVAAMSDLDAVPFTEAEWVQVKPLVRVAARWAVAPRHR